MYAGGVNKLPGADPFAVTRIAAGPDTDFPSLFDKKMLEAASAPLDETTRFLAWARYCQIHKDPARRELAVRLAKTLGLEDMGPGVAPAPPT